MRTAMEASMPKSNPNNGNTKASLYEQCREERIRENLQRMQNLGIMNLARKLQSETRPGKRPFGNSNPAPKSTPPTAPSRRSSRYNLFLVVSLSDWKIRAYDSSIKIRVYDWSVQIRVYDFSVKIRVYDWCVEIRVLGFSVEIRVFDFLGLVVILSGWRTQLLLPTTRETMWKLKNQRERDCWFVKAQGWRCTQRSMRSCLGTQNEAGLALLMAMPRMGNGFMIPSRVKLVTSAGFFLLFSLLLNAFRNDN